MFLVLSLVPFICTSCFACGFLLCLKHGGSRFFPKYLYISTKLQNVTSQKTVSRYKTGRVKRISQVSLSKGVQQHIRRNSAKHLVHGYPTFSWQRAGSWTTHVKIIVSGIPNHLYYVIFIVCMYVYNNNNNNNIYLLQLGCYLVAGVILLYTKCVCVCVIYECGCRPHNTTWWGASWRPMVYIMGCSEMWNSAVVFKYKQFWFSKYCCTKFQYILSTLFTRKRCCTHRVVRILTRICQAM